MEIAQDICDDHTEKRRRGWRGEHYIRQTIGQRWYHMIAFYFKKETGDTELELQMDTTADNW